MIVLFLFHTACALFYGYTIHFDYAIAHELERKSNYRYPIPGVHFSKLVWLTVVNLYVQFLYHSVGAVLAAVTAIRRGATTTRVSNVGSTLRREFHFLAATLVFPLAITVVVMFWSLYYINPDLVMDEQGKRVLAVAWFNHALHSVPAAVMVFDHLLWSHPRQKSTRTVLTTITSFACIYLAGVHYVHYFHSFWAYPILGELVPPLRILFLIFCSLVLYAVYLVGDLLLFIRQRAFVRAEVVPAEGKKKK